MAEAAIQLLQNHLSAAQRVYARTAESSDIEKRDLLQAALLCLNAGLSQYLASVMDVPRLTRISGLVVKPASSWDNYKQEEIAALLQQPASWLSAFANAIDSMDMLASDQQPQYQDARVIASSGAGCHPHWTELCQNDIASFIDAAQEMLTRHRDSDQEY